MYLVDTNVLSAGAPGKLPPPPDFAAWMERHSAQLYLSVITVAEVVSGIAKLRREGAGRRADRLESWLEAVLHLYSDRILALDIPTAEILGQLSDQARAAGHAPGLADLAIAATARRHDHTVLTRNLRHFQPLSVRARDPFEPPSG